jgi:hypothetical protein
MGFNPYNCSMKIQEYIEIPTPKVGVHLGVWRFIPSHSPALPHSREHEMLFPSFILGPYLGREPKARVATPI